MEIRCNAKHNASHIMTAFKSETSLIYISTSPIRGNVINVTPLLKDFCVAFLSVLLHTIIHLH